MCIGEREREGGILKELCLFEEDVNWVWWLSEVLVLSEKMGSGRGEWWIVRGGGGGKDV